MSDEVFHQMMEVRDVDIYRHREKKVERSSCKVYSINREVLCVDFKTCFVPFLLCKRNKRFKCFDPYSAIGDIPY